MFSGSEDCCIILPMKWITQIFLIMMIASPSLCFAGGEKDQWLAKAARSRLGESPQWARILLYMPRWLGSPTSMADRSDFFLSPDGGKHPSKELMATIESFFAPWSGAPDLHPLCRYPRRLKFIESSLSVKLPVEFHQACKAYHVWREENSIKGISLVFASNYLNNPASLYGHTFLRLHRNRDDGTGASPLLDYAVNFAANPTTDHPILYPLFGMTGRFFGTFSLMPYYVKVQEYNNAESRDLFEYPLTLTDDEVDSFMAMLWEVGPYGIRYWYMDENCSYVLLAMIAASKPELDVVDHFPGVVSPKDTLLVLKPTRILGTPVRRPSAMTRFKVRRADLAPEELAILGRQIKRRDLMSEIKNADPASKARMLDALLAWIAWEEKLAGSKMPEKQSKLWSQTLAGRANLGVTSLPLDLNKNPVTSPEEGHKSHRTYLALRSIERGPSELMFGLRLTLHDFASPPAGYSPDQETTMGDFQGVVRKKNDGSLMVEWERFTWVRILSVPSYDSMLPSPAWTLTAQTQRIWGYGVDSWLTHRLEGGAGIGYGNKAGSIRGWFIPVVAIGHLLPDMNPSIHTGIGLRSGLAADPATNLRFLVGLDVDRYLAKNNARSLFDVYSSASWMHAQKNEWRLNFHLRRIDSEALTKSAELMWMSYL